MVAGMSWSERMARSARTVAVLLSPEYLAPKACGAEWQAAWCVDLDGQGRRLLPVRVVGFAPPPFDGIVWTDLHDVTEEDEIGRAHV